MTNNIIRSFIAIPVPEISKIIKQMLMTTFDDQKVNIRWVKHSNLHLTLKFIGNMPENNISDYNAELKKIIECYNSFRLTLSGTGCFPNKSKPTVLYLGIDCLDNSLSLLYQEVSEFFKIKGYFDPTNKPFFPHITIARIKYPQKITPDVQTFLNSSYDSVDFTVNHLQFLSSEMLPKGIFYNLLGTFPLKINEPNKEI